LKELFRFFDAYNRAARLYPALIALAPVFWTGASLKPDLFAGDLPRVFGSVAVTCAVVVLFTNIARASGKTIEPRLIAAWGGWRTIVLLRHRDTTIDPYTKARYHAALEGLSSGLTMPTPAEEATNPAEADNRYRSATKRLIEQRRDPKYPLLHQENAQYGFRRNLLGLKAIALLLLCVALATSLGAWWFDLPRPVQSGRLFLDAATRWQVYSSIGGSVACVSMWLVLIRPRFVLLAADEYALALFRTLDE
jgi:hypothetical protein